MLSASLNKTFPSFLVILVFHCSLFVYYGVCCLVFLVFFVCVFGVVFYLYFWVVVVVVVVFGRSVS